MNECITNSMFLGWCAKSVFHNICVVCCGCIYLNGIFFSWKSLKFLKFLSCRHYQNCNGPIGRHLNLKITNSNTTVQYLYVSYRYRYRYQYQHTLVTCTYIYTVLALYYEYHLRMVFTKVHFKCIAPTLVLSPRQWTRSTSIATYVRGPVAVSTFPWFPT